MTSPPQCEKHLLNLRRSLSTPPASAPRSLREENAERTRERIADAVAAHLAERGTEGLSLPTVARRAGVSVATIYRYHPTREALLEAYNAWVQSRLGIRSYRFEVDEFPASVANAFRGFDAIEPTVRAQLNLAASRESFAHVRSRRLADMAANLEPVTRRLSPKDRAKACAAFATLTGAPAWQMMRDEWGLTGAEAGDAAAWAVRALLGALRARPDSLDDPAADPAPAPPDRAPKKTTTPTKRPPKKAPAKGRRKQP